MSSIKYRWKTSGRRAQDGAKKYDRLSEQNPILKSSFPMRTVFLFLI